MIRLHAIGDVAVTLPAAVALRESFPGAQIDMLTGPAAAPLAESLTTFRAVHRFPLCATPLERAYHAARMGARLSREHYDVVLDLQRNWVTRMIRRACRSEAWSEFDRFSQIAACDRVRSAVDAAGIGLGALRTRMPLRADVLQRGRVRLLEAGWDGASRLLCLNPGGLWKTRNWPLDRYREFAALYRLEGPGCILLLGDERLAAPAAMLEDQIPAPLLNLAGRTTLAEAFAALQHASLVVSEDSGLMHMAWASGIPTVALFGSTNHLQAAPLGAHAAFFHSGDLECGDCMLPECIHGDVRCLARRSATEVLEAARSLRPALR
jgi:ADP-heptose:LPS heptosyltransferase